MAGNLHCFVNQMHVDSLLLSLVVAAQIVPAPPVGIWQRKIGEIFRLHFPQFEFPTAIHYFIKFQHSIFFSLLLSIVILIYSFP